MMAVGVAMVEAEEEAGMDDFLSAMRARHVETQD